MLETLSCPSCGKKLIPRAGHIVAASSFESCLRQCTICGIAFSNASKRPTAIYKTIEQNVYLSTKDGIREVLGRAVNVRNRKNKLEKFAFQTSEDAVTWSVFRYLQNEDKLCQLLGLLGPLQQGPTELYLWGISTQPPYLPVVNGLSILETSKELGEKPDSITEPDVIIRSAASVIFIEVKLHSANQTTQDERKLLKYISKGKEYFRNTEKALESRHYELVRNWVVGNMIAGHCRFTLLNLGPSVLFVDKNSERLKQFVESLDAIEGKREFRCLSWETLIDDQTLFDKDIRKYLQLRLELKTGAR